jgi:hypothetical protein
MKLSNPIIILALHLLIMMMLVILGWHAAMGDWGNYYYGSKLFSVDNGMKAYDTDYFNHFVEVNGHERSFLSYTQVPPFSLLVFYPFSFLPVGIAKLSFMLFSYFLCVLSITRLFKKLKIDLKWTLLLPLLFLLSFKSNMEQGQTYFLIIALLSFGWIARENGKLIIAGFLFAFAIHLKIFPAIVLLWLFAERDWRMLGITISACLVLIGASLLFLHWEIWNYYGTQILPRLAKGEITNTYATTFQSIQVLLKQLFVPDALHNPSARFNSTAVYQWGIVVWTGIVLVTAFLFSFDKRQNSFSKFSMWIVAGMLISGYGSTYGLLLLIFPAIAIIQKENISSQRKLILLLIVALVNNIPVTRIMELPLPFSFLRLLFMVLFFVLLIYFLRPRWNKYALTALFIPLLSLLHFQKQEQGSMYFLKTEPSLLVTGFMLSGDTVYYGYRDGDGLHRSFQLFPEHITDVEKKADGNNYIFVFNPDKDFPGEQVKEKFIINKKWMLYLSDRNRGPGFTTIRMKKINL